MQFDESLEMTYFNNAFSFRFYLLESAPKMLYLNTSIRGYPKGLRAGSDPRKPLMAIDEGFENFEFTGISYPLDAMEVSTTLVVYM